MKMKNLLISLLVTGLIAGPAFAATHKNKTKLLPYGLQNNPNLSKPLPPGWLKKLGKGKVLEKQVYNHGKIVVPLDSNGLLTIRIEGKLIRLYKATREIAEILN